MLDEDILESLAEASTERVLNVDGALSWKAPKDGGTQKAASGGVPGMVWRDRSEGGRGVQHQKVGRA